MSLLDIDLAKFCFTVLSFLASSNLSSILLIISSSVKFIFLLVDLIKNRVVNIIICDIDFIYKGIFKSVLKLS